MPFATNNFILQSSAKKHVQLLRCFTRISGVAKPVIFTYLRIVPHERERLVGREPGGGRPGGVAAPADAAAGLGGVGLCEAAVEEAGHGVGAGVGDAAVAALARLLGAEGPREEGIPDGFVGVCFSKTTSVSYTSG